MAALLPYTTTTMNLVEGSTVGFLNVVYSGHGFVEMRADGLHLSPQVADGPVRNGGAYGYDTHASLVTADAGLLGSSYTLRLSMRTIEQLRQDGPAPWERAWLLFDYADSLNYSYVILKANGWEIGRVTNGVQSFDATGNDPRFTVGGADQLTILRTTEHLTVVINDVALFDTVLTGARPMSYRSAVYTEDAHISVDQWSISNAPLRTAASTSPGTGITQPRVAAPAA